MKSDPQVARLRVSLIHMIMYIQYLLINIVELITKLMWLAFRSLFAHSLKNNENIKKSFKQNIL